ncbi:MAG TPA: hypothetical protein VF582_05005 [Allosphingosinicella sp.]|jgi:hypothetical protein
MNRTALTLAAAISLSACGGNDNAVENTAAQLENAADQSDPAAAAVLDNAAEQVLQQNSTAPAQGALEAAGNAQIGGRNAGPMAPQAQQAKPHAPGDPVPPPKVKTGQ